MITHDGFQFPHKHGLIHEGDLEPDIQVNRFPGIKGVSVLVGETGSRLLSCSYILDGFANLAAARDALDQIAQKHGQLDGTVNVSGTISDSFEHCTFLKFQCQPGYPKRDAAQNKWFVRGMLFWLQRKV